MIRNKPITTSEIEAALNIPPPQQKKKKSPRTDFKEALMPMIFKLFQKIERK